MEAGVFFIGKKRGLVVRQTQDRTFVSCPPRRKCRIRFGIDRRGSWVRVEHESCRVSGKGTQSCVASSIEHVFLVPLRRKCLIRVAVDTEGSINLRARAWSWSESWRVRGEGESMRCVACQTKAHSRPMQAASGMCFLFPCEENV